ncbi:calmodulin isoform X2 [Eurytemora carolleeae]|uniref:calmodulin isoform X2 n=1 Tax=Eurytemora carolleeae TaxID=1294199 RepID=UPI000C789886|nr:calmodulin isoform X2 [Eurytemora carolleeae]|eukprot:XP_023330019.1 calmodulin-like isoform X2 [Eurytemora affinis]
MTRRPCSTFEQMFKKKVLTKNTLAESVKDNTALDIAAYRKTFEKFDDDGNGEIDVGEFGTMIRSLGLSPTDSEIQILFNKMDTDESGFIEFNEFIHILDHSIMNRTREDTKDILLSSFRKLQPNRLMKVNDLKKVLTQYGSMAMTEDEVEDLIRQVNPSSTLKDEVDYNNLVEKLVEN